MWIEKEWLREIIRVTKEWGFKYVENFCWIKKNVNNRIALQPGKLFNKSKLSLLIFRIGGDVDLRHQRNPDCVFDFVQPIEPGKRRIEKEGTPVLTLLTLCRWSQWKEARLFVPCHRNHVAGCSLSSWEQSRREQTFGIVSARGSSSVSDTNPSLFFVC